MKLTPAPRSQTMPKALVVDDNMMNRVVLASMLTLRGYMVSEAISASAALPLLDAGPYALVMLDIMMPGMSGTEFCQVIRQREGEGEGERQTIIAYTALSDASDLAAIRQAGFDEVLRKPVDGNALDRAIEKVGAACRPRRFSSYTQQPH